MSAVSKDHFEFFSLPRWFEIDRTRLGDAFRRVQAAVHPDRHAASGEMERRIAMQLATKANEAFRTLDDPLARARYLCGLLGEDVAAESNTAMPAGFLVQQMAWREALDEAGDEAALAVLAAEVDARRAATLDGIRAAFDDAGDARQAAGLVRELMFVERFARELGERRGRRSR